MNIYSNEQGEIAKNILIVFVVLFALSFVVAVVGHNLLVALVLLVIAILLYPLGIRVVRRVSS